MAAYGLYTHIQSNRRRSIALLIGLFFLVYVMVYAGALVAERLDGGGMPTGQVFEALAPGGIRVAVKRILLGEDGLGDLGDDLMADRSPREGLRGVDAGDQYDGECSGAIAIHGVSGV